MSEFEIPAHILAQRVVTETVLVDLIKGNYYELNEIGTEIFRALQQKTDLPSLVDSILERYQVDRPTLERDLAQLLTELQNEGLVNRQGQPQNSSTTRLDH